MRNMRHPFPNELHDTSHALTVVPAKRRKRLPGGPASYPKAMRPRDDKAREYITNAKTRTKTRIDIGQRSIPSGAVNHRASIATAPVVSAHGLTARNGWIEARILETPRLSQSTVKTYASLVDQTLPRARVRRFRARKAWWLRTHPPIEVNVAWVAYLEWLEAERVALVHRVPAELARRARNRKASNSKVDCSGCSLCGVVH